MARPIGGRIEPLLSEAKSRVEDLAYRVEGRVHDWVSGRRARSAGDPAVSDEGPDTTQQPSPVADDPGERPAPPIVDAQHGDPEARYRGHELLHSDGAPITDATMLDFWQWAYSDLTDNVNRGVFAEWMVSSLLGIKSGATRVPWDAYDLLTPDGIRVEVKATAYVQAWTLNGAPVVSKPSSIRFTGLCGRLWTDSGQTQVADEATFNADVYVFCLQSDQDPSTWDALDLDQWEFYVLSKARVERNGCKTMGVSTLRSLTSAVEPERLREAVIAANAEQREN